MALNRGRVVAEAVALLDEAGLDGVTLRRLATRLGVSQPTLYWHLPNKAALVVAIADAILEPAASAAVPHHPDEPWPDWLSAFAHRLRRALLAHPDGARIVSTAQLSTAMNALSETAMSTLVAAGVALRDARLAVLTVERFTVGHVLEEQAPRPEPTDADPAAFAAAHPTATAAVADYFTPGRTVDDLFEDCLALVVAGVAAGAAGAAGGPVP